MCQCCVVVILVCLIEFQNALVILDGILIALGTLADQALVFQAGTMIESNVEGKRSGDALRQGTRVLYITEEGRHDASLPLGCGIQ